MLRVASNFIFVSPTVEEIRLRMGRVVGGGGAVTQAVTDELKVSHWQTHSHLQTDEIAELHPEFWWKVMQVEASFSDGVN